MSGVNARSGLSLIAKLGRPILSILGVKQDSVAGKVDQAVEAVDSVLPPPPETPAPKDPSP